MSAPAEVATGLDPGTLAFTDIVGFTEFTAVQGDQHALELLERHERLLEAMLPASARIVKNLGDGFLLWFDDPREAVCTLLEFQRQLEDVDDESWPLAVRIGAHWGRPLRRGDDLVGHDVNVAARILDVAGPGEVLVSETLLDELRARGGPLDCDELGPVSMKGLPDAIRLYRLSRT